jgi:hypothetical protein
MFAIAMSRRCGAKKRASVETERSDNLATRFREPVIDAAPEWRLPLLAAGSNPLISSLRKVYYPLESF